MFTRFARVHSCSLVFARVHSCSLVFALVFARVHSCSLVFARVHSCSLVFALVFARVRSCSLVFALVCTFSIDRTKTAKTTVVFSVENNTLLHNVQKLQTLKRVFQYYEDLPDVLFALVKDTFHEHGGEKHILKSATLIELNIR